MNNALALHLGACPGLNPGPLNFVNSVLLIVVSVLTCMWLVSDHVWCDLAYLGRCLLSPCFCAW